MKISKVEAIPLAIPFHHGMGRGRELDFCLVRVETDAGLVGWGEAFSYSCRSAVAAAVRDMIAPLALGHDAADIEGLHTHIQKRLHIFGRFGITAFALSGLDIALWDIAAKAAGLPLHQLLGGAKRTSIPCYASLLRYSAPADVSTYCEQALREGYTAIKLHEVDDAAVAGGRQVVPASVPLMLDVNCQWTLREAIDAALRFKPHQLHWLEEPVFPPEDLGGLRAVGEASGTPLAAGENLCFATQFAALLDARAVRYIQPSVTKVGGITEFLKIIELAAGAGIAPHSPYFGPGAIATLHLIAALLPEARFEYFYLWADATLYPGLFGQPSVEVPNVAIEPDPDVIRRYRA
jgi:L-alanine-DL-glutamate epimerase-like enolase superfamily enzyme